MSTDIRPNISSKNKYYISKERYYELKHFCLQYKEWKAIYNELCNSTGSGIVLRDRGEFNPEEALYVREKYLDRIQLIEECALLTDRVLGDYILEAVTEGKTYRYFRLTKSIPCCKDVYYDLYRRFFYILSKKKDIA